MRKENLRAMMEDLSLHILDIAENAIAAGATRIAVSINENEERNLLTFRVTDNGPGMPKENLRQVLDPFFTTKGKRTGLGLPLLAQAAEQCGGRMTVSAPFKKGTAVAARFRYDHIDRPPLTNMKETMTVLILSHPEISFVYGHRRNGQVFRFSSRRFLKQWGASLRLSPEIIELIKKEFEIGLKRIGST